MLTVCTFIIPLCFSLSLCPLSLSLSLSLSLAYVILYLVSPVNDTVSVGTNLDFTIITIKCVTLSFGLCYLVLSNFSFFTMKINYLVFSYSSSNYPECDNQSKHL